MKNNVSSFIIPLFLLIGINSMAQSNNDTTITISKDVYNEILVPFTSDSKLCKADVPQNHNESPIATDRPDQTESPFLVPKGRLQIETGVWVEFDRDDSIEYENFTYNTTLLKYGLSRHIELRFIFDYMGAKQTRRSDKTVLSNIAGVQPLAIGTKIFICEQHKFLPKTAIIAHLGLPIGHPNFVSNNVAADFRFVFQHTLSDRFAFSYNVGAEWDGVNTNATYIYTASLGINLVGGLNMFIESYGFMTEQNDLVSGKLNGNFIHDHRLDAGFTFAPIDILQFDVSGGLGLSAASPDGFISGGVSLRLPK